MSIINSQPLIGASGQGGGYNLTKSLRFRSSASAYLNRTMTTATNNLKWTWSAWVKRGKLTDTNIVFGAGDGTSDNFGAMQFTSGDVIQFAQINGGSYNVQVTTNAVFRDPSAWYHVVLVYDSPNATSTDRIQIYVNGTRQSVTYTTGPFAQDTSSKINSALAHYISKLDYASLYFDGYMAEINFIDGQALTPSSFGQTSPTTGVWQPIAYTGTYGTNGFYLPFTDVATTSGSNAGLGKDFSGNGNYWTTNNISVTSGSTYDSMKDVPTLTDTDTANYCVLNPLAMYGTNAVISNGNLTSSVTSTLNDRGWASTIVAPNSGKWYAEFIFTATAGDNNGGCGVMLENGTGVPGESATTVSWRDSGTLRQNATSTSYGSALTTNDVVIVAYDADLGRVWFGKNGTWFSSGDPANNSNPSATGITSSGRFATYHYNTNATIQANFGQRPFAYTPPTGFVALNTFNISAGTITTSGSFTGNAATDGPFIYLNGVPTAMTINGNAVTFGTHADKLANGFKVRSSSSSYNASGSNTYSISTTSDKFKYANAQPNP